MKKEFELIQNENIPALLKKKEDNLIEITKERSVLAKEGRKNSNKIKLLKKDIARIETAITLKILQEVSNGS